MMRVHVICEGQTEEAFVNNLLQPSFAAKGIVLLPSLIGKPGHKGGNFKIERLLNDVRNRLTGDRAAYCTTLFDFYGLPSSFPGRTEAANLHGVEEKAEHICTSLQAVIREQLGEDVARRFVPYVQMHEFEGLLFSHPDVFAASIDRHELAPRLIAIRNKFASPEAINDSPQTAPSKRIIDLIPEYEKPLMGTIGSLEIGLPTMRAECPLFDDWLTSLEALGVDRD